MGGLGDTTAFLSRLRKSHGAAMGQATPGSSFVETAGFRPNPASLRMLSHTPRGLPPGAPLVVALHGCTQQGEAYAECAGWRTLADRWGFAVLAPEQTPANNPNRCFNWFAADDVTRGGGEVASIAAMIGSMIKTHRLDAERVYVTGLSAGGAMTAAMLAAYPDLFAGGGVIAGLPSSSAIDLKQALTAMQMGDRRDTEILVEGLRRASPGPVRPIKLAVWHGDADLTVNIANAHDIVRQWAGFAGLTPSAADEARTLRYHRQVWTGDHILELTIVHGLGHGTPLATLGEGDVGRVAPFMLETGLSSTLELARFWGLGPTPGYNPAAATAAAAPPHHGLAGRIEDVIGKALRSAGLMK